MKLVVLGLFWVVCTFLLTCFGVPETAAEVLGVTLPTILAAILKVSKDSSSGKNGAEGGFRTQPGMGRQEQNAENGFSEYREPLRSGGELVVTPSEWSIRYYFPASSRWKKDTAVEIHSSRIAEYQNAWEENYKEYLSMRYQGGGRKAVKKGLAGMSVRFGTSAQGVCLRDCHMPVCTREAIDEIVSDYAGAPARVREIRELLNDPDAEKKLRIRLVRCLRSRLLERAGRQGAVSKAVVIPGRAQITE